MKKYVEPELEIVKFDSQVMCSEYLSGDVTNQGWNLGTGEDVDEW